MELTNLYNQLYSIEIEQLSEQKKIDQVEKILVSLNGYNVSDEHKIDIIRDCLDYSLQGVFQTFMFNDLHLNIHELLIHILANYSSVWNITVYEKKLPLIDANYRVFYSDVQDNKIGLIAYNNRIKAMAYSTAKEITNYLVDDIIIQVKNKYTAKSISLDDVIKSLGLILEEDQVIECLFEIEDNIYKYSGVLLQKFNLFYKLDAQIRFANKTKTKLDNVGLKILAILAKENKLTDYLDSRLGDRSLLDNDCKALLKKFK